MRTGLRRPCRICGLYFVPTGWNERLCPECFKHARRLAILKRRRTLEKKYGLGK